MSSYNRRTTSSSKKKPRPTATKTNKYNGTKSKKSKKRTILKFFIGLLTFSIIVAAAGIIYLSYLSKTLPTWDESAFDQSTTSKIYDMDDNVVSMKFQNENRTPISYSQMSPDFISAILATEDADFYLSLIHI